MKKTLILLFFLISFSNALSLYCVPNEVAIPRSSNFSFIVTTDLAYHNYFIQSNNEQIVLNSNHNTSHIFVDLYVPSIVPILFFYELDISTYDVAGDFVENGTFYFVIGNLTNAELFYILSEYKIKEDELVAKDEVIAELVNASNNTTINGSAWDGYDFRGFTEKYGDSTLMTMLTFACTFVVGLIGMLKIKHTSAIKIKQTEKEKDQAIQNRLRVKLTNQAVSYSANIYKEVEIDGAVMELELLNVCEIEAMNKYVINCDVTPFLRPDKEQYKDENNNVCDSNSIHQFTTFLNKHKAGVYDKYYCMSACIKYLDFTGRKTQNDNLFPVRCDLEALKDHFGILTQSKLEKESKDLKIKKPETINAGDKLSSLQKRVNDAKNITPVKYRETTEIIDEINYLKNR